MKFSVLLMIIFANLAAAQVNLVKVEKSEGKMYLLENDRTVKKYHVAFGANPNGHKQQEGDERTSEGSYSLDYKKENSAFYRAMHISYPNAADKAAAQTQYPEAPPNTRNV
jgi:murein L,D-transpeptidase YafK